MALRLSVMTKRGVGKSEGDYWATGFKDRIQDAFEALGELKQQDTIQPIKSS